MFKSICIFTGHANPELAEQIAHYLGDSHVFPQGLDPCLLKDRFRHIDRCAMHTSLHMYGCMHRLYLVPTRLSTAILFKVHSVKTTSSTE